MMTIGCFPELRLRRLRHAPWLRDMLTQHRLTASDLIWPIFVRDPSDDPLIPSMPGVVRYTLADLLPAVHQAYESGVRAIALFPKTPSSLKTPDAGEALNPNNLICQAIRLLKKDCPMMGVIADVALDPYTNHGHDGVLVEGDVHNDQTVEILARQACVLAAAGADIVAPSDMMDGRVRSIRKALDNAGFSNVLIMSYAVKFASDFYGPFRQAVGAAGLCAGPCDKKTYQLNPANINEALREIAQDLEEGADMIIIKPGLPYLDVLTAAAQMFTVPIFAYQVSGEYAMIQAAHQNGWVDGPQVMAETLLAFKRAGAQGILTYSAPEMAARLP